MKVLLTFRFNGTAYCGFQVQKNGVSVQQRLQDAIESALGVRYPLCGCSRTDSGVHANMFCATIDTGDDICPIPAKALPVVLNRYLPDDISVFDAEVKSAEFHPRHDAILKEYKYIILNSKYRDPYYSDRAWHYVKHLSEQKMNTAAADIVGKKDFSAFMAAGSKVITTVRDVKYCNVCRENEIVTVTVAADGFLYNMVRIIVGTLIEVSNGKLAQNAIPEIIESHDRTQAGFTAPPQGLYLNRVVY